MKDGKEINFEDSLSDEWARDFGVREVPLDGKPLFLVGAAVFGFGFIIFSRIIFLSAGRGDFYEIRAQKNLTAATKIEAPRGLILDRNGEVLAENKPVFSAMLDADEFARASDKKKILDGAESALGISPDSVWKSVRDKNGNFEKFAESVILKSPLTNAELLAVKDLNLSAINVKNDFERYYPQPRALSSLLGYVGFVDARDLESDSSLAGYNFIGKSGAEAFYDKDLRGETGLSSKLKDAKGRSLGWEEEKAPVIGKTIKLAVDGRFQEYFFGRMQEGLAVLGRTSGVGLAMDPQSGEILAYMNFPSFDANVMSSPSKAGERSRWLNDGVGKPFFNRAISGAYNPGSTIKPLVGVAALAEKIISPTRTIFSPGYLEIPNPYDPEKPTRYADWRYQGDVDLSAALAKSSNVYFYTAGGGALDIKGLGINRLRQWWEKFRLGTPTGIDLPGEARGFLPSPEWKEKNTKRPWLLGDTYNVSIGQGDLLLTPIQLLNYISAIANGGKIYQPIVNKELPHPKILADLSDFKQEIAEVQKGMAEAVKKDYGTAHILSDLPFSVAAKTGTAQIQNNTQQNAFFVGYITSDNPRLAILILIENAREGSLNTVPIAKDVLEWYYENRISKLSSVKL